VLSAASTRPGRQQRTIIRNCCGLQAGMPTLAGMGNMHLHVHVHDMLRKKEKSGCYRRHQINHKLPTSLLGSTRGSSSTCGRCTRPGARGCCSYKKFR
jgi:hypothetical protein